MKNSIILAEILFVCLLASCVENGYSITGQAPWEDGQAVLSYSTPNDLSIKDTCVLKNGLFQFKGSVSDVVRGRICLSHEGESPLNAFFFVENAPLTVTLDLDSCVDYGSDREVRKTQVTGGPNNDMAAEIASVMDDLGKTDYFAEMVTALKELEGTGFDPEKRDAFLNDYQSVYEEFADSIDVLSRRVVLSHPDEEVAGYFFKRYFNGQSLDIYEASFNQLSEKVRNCFLSTEVRQEIEALKATAPGAETPLFKLSTREGEEIALSSFRGQYVILDFWASWCGPCRAGMPAMKELYAKYHDKGLEVIGISTDHRTEDWTKALDELDLPWINVIDIVPAKNKPTETATRYGVHFIPSYFLIDKEGRMIGKMEHEALESELAALF